MSAEFAASMPPAYRQSFDADAIRIHAEIVARRTGRGAHVEIWRELPDRVVSVCVVADDKPGLLSSISAALVESRIDVVSADAFCRTRADGKVEAVDFLSIRRLAPAAPIRAEDIAALADAIDAATTNLDSVQLRAAQAAAPAGPATSARLRFGHDDESGRTVLTVEAVDRPGLLLAVTQALFRAGVQIVGLRATTENGCAVDRFQLAEPTGQSLKNERLLELQSAVLGALDEGLNAARSA